MMNTAGVEVSTGGLPRVALCYKVMAALPDVRASLSVRPGVVLLVPGTAILIYLIVIRNKGGIFFQVL